MKNLFFDVCNLIVFILFQIEAFPNYAVKSEKTYEAKASAIRSLNGRKPASCGHSSFQLHHKQDSINIRSHLDRNGARGEVKRRDLSKSLQSYNEHSDPSASFRSRSISLGMTAGELLVIVYLLLLFDFLKKT